MPEEKAFQEAIQAVEQGQIARARDLFTRLLKRDSSNPDYWLWMSAVVETTAERIYCLENVLHLAPDHEAAKRGLILMEARQADDTLPPAPVIKRKWNTPPIPKEPQRPVLQRLASNRLVQVAGIVCAILLLASIVYWGSRMPAPQSSSTATFIVVAITAQPTQTASATPTPHRTITPSLAGATPLWAFLKATYTPRPAYVNTPHPVSEAFKIALRSFERGDYSRMVSYLEQALRDEPQSPDITYLLGEGYRLMGNDTSALENFEKAIEINPNFAPPYLGRALVNGENHPKQDITADLERAIGLDPYLVEAYFALTEYHLNRNDLEAADEVLKGSHSILSYEDPRDYWLQARLHLAQEDFPAALEAAQYAIELDQTMLPAYLTLAEAYFTNGQNRLAVEKAQVYLRYEPENPQAWLILAQAQFTDQANPAETLKSLGKAIELNPQNPEILWYRGLILLEEGKNQAAINDLLQAVRLDGSSFDYNLDLGRALYMASRYTDAYRQLNVAERMAEADPQIAAVIYWRARALEAAGNFTQAKNEWKKFLTLPPDAMAPGWLSYAREHLYSLETPTPSVTFTPTATQQATPTPTRTPTVEIEE